MSQYDVTMPVVGYTTITIEAETAEAAISAAHEQLENGGIDDFHDIIVFDPDNAEDIANVERASASENDPESDEQTQQAETL